MDSSSIPLSMLTTHLMNGDIPLNGQTFNAQSPYKENLSFCYYDYDTLSAPTAPWSQGYQVAEPR